MITLNSKASGFVVLRLPDQNRDEAGRGVFTAQTPCIGEVCYGGIDRMPWFDIDEDLYAGGLPANIEQARKLIEEDNADFYGIELCKDLSTALALLDYSNRSGIANELIALRSEVLADIKGTIDLDPSLVSWDGYDIVLVGGWSLLRDGLFTSPSSFTGWETALTASGLFSSPSIADDYIRAYEAAVLKGTVEGLSDSYEVDIVQVGKLHKRDIV